MNELIMRELNRMNGWYYDSLTSYEREVIDEAIKRGLAVVDFVGVAGMLGLGKVRRI